MLRTTAWLIVMAALQVMLAAAPAKAAIAPVDLGTAADIESRTGLKLSLDQPLLDHKGRAVRISEITRGEPLLLVPVDYGCRNICGVTLRGLFTAVAELNGATGPDFKLVALGLDPGTPRAVVEAQRQQHLDLLKAPRAAAAVHFLSGQSEPVLDELGFRYTYDAATDQYAHPAAVAVISANGRLSSWLYGYPFTADDLRVALREAAGTALGSPGEPSLIERVWLMCFRYDPVEGAYTPTIVASLRIAGSLTVLVVAALIIGGLRARRSTDDLSP